MLSHEQQRQGLLVSTGCASGLPGPQCRPQAESLAHIDGAGFMCTCIDC